MKNTLIIIGASGHGKVVADVALKMNKWKEIYFLDNNNDLNTVLGIKVIGRANDYKKYINDSDVFVAIGDNKIRKKIIEELQIHGASIPTLIHPKSIIGQQVKVKLGTVIMAGCVVNSHSEIGIGCIINTSASVDHDNIIGNYVHISPGVSLAGNVRIGSNTWLGIGCNVINNINIENNIQIGAGALIIENITIPGKYVGVPVRRI